MSFDWVASIVPPNTTLILQLDTLTDSKMDLLKVQKNKVKSKVSEYLLR